ncbi:SH3 domain-containing protein [Falsiroseomonas sp. HW251]|uniref:SH3 domain-containing protein n=1 Tax=Falsiroseomonas sp. HW251 TaxID=3390998 RepID=UPI003D31EA7B
MRRLCTAWMIVASLAACREEPEAPSRAATPEPRHAAALEAAHAAVRARLRAASELRQRGVQVFPQAMKPGVAVCGRAALPGAAEAFLPYVAVVTFEGDAPRVSDFAIAASGPEATRVFLLLSERCFEGGGPPSLRAVAGALPPLPDWNSWDAESGATTLPAAASGPTMLPAASGPTAPPSLVALRRIVTTSRSGANIRSAPRDGEVLRVAPRSTPLEVYGEAPGGWLQVGTDGVAWGWMHNSLLDAAPR